MVRFKEFKITLEGGGRMNQLEERRTEQGLEGHGHGRGKHDGDVCQSSSSGDREK